MPLSMEVGHELSHGTEALALACERLPAGLETRKLRLALAQLAVVVRVGIDAEKAAHPVLKLSGGEQQRVGIARALSHDPKVVIADEPTGNLDSQTEAQVMDILAGLAHDEGKAVVVVTHANSVASRADEVWGLNRGKMVFVR